MPCRSARAFIITKKTGTKISTFIVEVIMPPTIGAAMGFITSDPTPVSCHGGSRQQECTHYLGRASNGRTVAMAKFLVKAGQPDRLEYALGGKKYLTTDTTILERGKVVFAETCAHCHSSKLPDAALTKLDPGSCSGPGYLTCWKRYWDFAKIDEFKAKMKEIVTAPDFLKDNYLSTDARIPVTLLRTNACSPLGTNAIRNNIWDNFSSSTYKELPSVGIITVQDPFTGERRPYKMPGGGLGYTRVPSLVSIWSTAPFLVNNQLGPPFDDNPSVESRMKSFEGSIEQLLWPETPRRP